MNGENWAPSVAYCPSPPLERAILQAKADRIERETTAIGHQKSAVCRFISVCRIGSPNGMVRTSLPMLVGTPYHMVQHKHGGGCAWAYAPGGHAMPARAPLERLARHQICPASSTEDPEGNRWVVETYRNTENVLWGSGQDIEKDENGCMGVWYRHRKARIGDHGRRNTTQYPIISCMIMCPGLRKRWSWGGSDSENGLENGRWDPKGG